MTCRPSVLALLVFTVTIGAQRIAAQELAMAKPRFIATWVAPGEPDDASGASVLQRRVSLDLGDVPIGVALRQVASQARLDLSYDKSVLPAGRRVSLHAQELTVVAALTEILVESGLDVAVGRGGQLGLVRKVPAAVADSGTIAGQVTDKAGRGPLVGATVTIEGTRRATTSGEDGRYQIEGVPVGSYTVRARYIGYTPGSVSVTVTAGQEATADFALQKSIQKLDEVVTTGTVVPTEVKALPTPISVVTAEDIQQQNLRRVDQIFRGQVPGAIAWDGAAGGDELSIIQVRGSSALSAVPTVKTFIDGVEVADPEFIATIDPNSVERIEITRGPQASTLYGAGALSGVMQIFTKKGQLGLARPEVTGKASVGSIAGLNGGSSAPQTDGALTILGGGQNTSYSLGGSYRHQGEWTPSYHSTDWGLSTGVETTQGPLKLSGSARYASKSLDNAWKTWFKPFTAFSQPPFEGTDIRQQTYGATARLRAARTWQHTLTVGYDQHYLSGENTQPRFTTPADSFVAFYATHEAKTSLVYHTDLNIQLGAAAAATVTAGVNYDAYDFVSSFTGGATRTTGSLDGSTFLQHAPSTNTGYFGQAQVNLADRLFLTGGLRAERNPTFGVDFGTAWSPRVGAAYILGLGSATVKARVSYGESIRAPSNGQRDAFISPFQIQVANPNLAPERQRGVDGGVDVYLGGASVGVTYYSQRAVDLIAAINQSGPGVQVPTVQNQNVSRVKNQGWEFEAHIPVGPMQISGTYSITHSTVQALFPNYPSGGYQVGDDILGVPRSSAGVTVSYSPVARTTLSASMTHVGHWMEHDWIAEYGFFFGGQTYRGSDRAYWMEYPSVTKFTVGASQVVTPQLTAFVRAENVGNNLRYEQNNITFRMPRSLVAGANVGF